MSSGPWKQKDEALVCGQLGPPPPDTLTPPICNRVPHHEPPHRRYNPRTYAIEAEWTDAQAKQARKSRRG